MKRFSLAAQSFRGNDQTLSGPQLFCSSIRGRPCRDRMSKRSPSADDDDRDRFQATKSRKRSSNKGGGGGSIQSRENCSLSPFVQAPSWSPHSAAGRHTQLAFPVCPPSMMLTLFLYCIPSFPHSTTPHGAEPWCPWTTVVTSHHYLPC